MSKYFKPTIIFMVASVLLVTVYDVWAVSHNYNWTISYNLYEVCKAWPIIPFLGGVLIGHTLWINKAASKDGDFNG